MAEAEGIEPSLAVLEAAVLPLNDTPVGLAEEGNDSNTMPEGTHNLANWLGPRPIHLPYYDLYLDIDKFVGQSL